MGNEGISIIICTYNGEDVIAKCLKHIQKQNMDNSVDWEVVLVNNNSTDDTVSIAKETWNQGSCKAAFRIIDQPVPGRANALKKGLKKARYEFVLNCDDDNLLDESYLQIAYTTMANNPEIGFLGGRGFPQTEGKFPYWFDNFKILYACGSQSTNGNDITNQKEYVYGAGSVFRKSIFEGLNDEIYFRTLPGRKNNNLTGGDDNLMGYVTVIAGYRIWYSDRLRFIHLIPKDRLKWEYVLNLKYSNGKAQIYLDPYTDFIRNNHHPKSCTGKIVTVVKHLLSLIKNHGINLFKRKEGSQKDVVYHYYLGKLTELLKLNFSYQKEYQKSIQNCKIVEKKKAGYATNNRK